MLSRVKHIEEDIYSVIKTLTNVQHELFVFFQRIYLCILYESLLKTVHGIPCNRGIWNPHGLGMESLLLWIGVLCSISHQSLG